MNALKRIGLGLLAVALVSTMAVMPFQGKTSAAPGDDGTHPYEAAVAYQAFWGFRHCVYGDDERGDLPVHEVRDADIFEDAIDQQQYRPAWIRAQDNRSGNCDNGANILEMFHDMGIADPLNFLAHEFTVAGESMRFYNPDGSTYRLNTDIGDSERVALLAGYLADENRYPDVNFLGESLPIPEQYFVIKAHFERQCIDARNVPEDQGGTEVRMVANDGTEETISVVVSGNNYEVGYGLGTRNASDRWDGSSFDCSSMASLLNRYADDTIAAVTEWIERNPDGLIPANNAIDAEEDNSCETNSGVVGWFMCPIAGMLDSATGFMDEQIESMLLVKDSYFEPGSDSGDGLKAVWSQVRNIAFIILIPIMLVMVIGTALNMDVFSAYTVKKALPRMVIAIIFISLSWYICVFMVDLFNTAGRGARGLVVSPFSQIVQNDCEVPGATDCNRPQSSLKGALTAAGIVGQADSGIVEAGGSGIGLGLVSAVGIFALAGAGVISVAIIGSTLFSAALILGAVLLLLIARQMIILGLVIIAPVAILAWIFPGNDKLWKIWWGAFTKLLMIFPVIMLVIGVGQVFAFIIGLSRSGGNWIANLVTVVMIIAAYVIPYFFIPMAFKWAGGVFGNLAGMVNNAEKGILDRGKKKRSEARKELRERADNNMRWNPRGKLGGFNSMASWAANPVANAKVALGTAGGREILGDINRKQVEHTNKMAQQLSALSLNDRAGKALAGFANDKTQKRINEAVRTGQLSEGLREVKTVADIEHNARVLSGSFQRRNAATGEMETVQIGDDNDRLAANQINSAGVRGLVEGSWKDPDLQKANIGAAGLLTSASQGFAEREEIAELANRFIQRDKKGNVVDSGLAAQMAGNLSLAAYKGGRLDMKPGYGVQYNDKIGKYVDGLSGGSESGNDAIGPVTREHPVRTSTQAQVDKQIALYKTLKPHDIVSAKPATLKAMHDGIVELGRVGPLKDSSGNDIVDPSTGKPIYDPETTAVRQQIINGASQFSGGDVGSKSEWIKIAEQAGLIDEVRRVDARYDAADPSRTDQRPAPPPPPPEPGGS